MDMSARTCDPCGKSLDGFRADAEHCSTACRMKAHRKKNPPIPPGPSIAELIEAYTRKLQSKTPGALRTFKRIAPALAPLATRPVLTVSASEWEHWLADVTRGKADSTKALLRRYVLAMLKGTPHFLAAASPRLPRPQVGRAARPDLLVSEAMPRTERTRLVVILIAVGLYPREIQVLTLDETGQVQAGRANWGRHSRPPIPFALQERLLAFAKAKRIAPGAPLFPISSAAISEILRRLLRKKASAEGDVSGGCLTHGGTW